MGIYRELSKPSPVGEGGPPTAVDEEFLTFVTTHPSARQHLINSFMHVARIHLLSQEKALLGANSLVI